MSTFYVFYLSSDNKNDFKQIKQTVVDNTPSVTEGIAKGRPQITENTEDLLSIWCEFFSLSVKNGGQPIIFRSEDYGMGFQYQFWFDVYNVTPNWLEGMLSFVGKIMNLYEGDCVLESNGDTPIVMRKNKNITVDDRKLKKEQMSPFDELGLVYQTGELKQV